MCYALAAFSVAKWDVVCKRSGSFASLQCSVASVAKGSDFRQACQVCCTDSAFFLMDLAKLFGRFFFMSKLSITRRLVYTALLTAMLVVLKYFRLEITDSFKVGFTYIPCFLAGVFLGPIPAFAVGIVGDLLSSLLRGWTINPMITLGSGMMGVLMWLPFRMKFLKFTWLKTLVGGILVLFIVTLGINTYALTLPMAYPQYPSFLTALATRALQPVILAINLVLTYPLIIALKRLIFPMAEIQNV